MKTFCLVLPWFSLYQVLYSINQFFDKKVNLELEYHMNSYLYIDFIHRRYYYEKFNKEVYYNIHYNILGNRPPLIDKITLNRLNDYVLVILS